MNESIKFKAEMRANINDLIVKTIARGQCQLPSEKSLALKYNVSRETIRTLLLELEYEGRIFRRHGSGTYINTDINTRGLIYPCQLFRDVIASYGYTPSVKVISSAFLNDSPASELLGLRPGEAVFRFSRIYYADHIPCIFSSNYADAAFIEKQDISFYESADYSIYDILDQFAAKKSTALLWDDTELYAAPFSELAEYGDHLHPEADQHPIMALHSLYYALNNIPLLYSKSYIDTSLIRFHLVRAKQP